MEELIEKIKEHTDSSIVINGFNEIIAVNDLDEETILHNNATRAIESFFDKLKVHSNHPSGDPQLEAFVTVSGKEYVELMFNKSYDDALEYIVENTH
jgi:predicted glycosyltransferase